MESEKVMGLDNGIMVRRETMIPALIKFDTDWQERNDCDIEIAYWRKCWNVRSVILYTLGINSDNDLEFDLSRNNIKDIIAALKKMTNKKEYYNDYGGCIWDWRDFKRIQKRNIRALRRLYRIMGKHDLSVYFYDSY